VRALLLILLSAALGGPGLKAAEVKPAMPEPVVVKPGDPMLDTSVLRPVKSKWKVSQVTFDGKAKPDWGTATYEIELVEVGGKAAIRRTQVLTAPDRTITEVATADRKTLAPIRSEDFDSKGFVHRVDFMKDRVQVERSTDPPGGATTKRELKLDMDVFDFFVGPTELLFASLPLKEGFAAKVPTLEQDAVGTGWHEFKVVGKEAVDDGTGHQVEAWIVETPVAQFVQRLWIAKQPPYLLRLKNTGPRGGYQLFERVP